jgi:hypothetical protein
VAGGENFPAGLNLSTARYELPPVRHFQLARRAGIPTAAVLLGVLAAGPALADVVVSPTSAPQGSGQNFTFHVTNDGTEPISQVKLSLPGDTSVAEMYPLSVDDWAPKIDMRKLATPLPQIHGGVPVTEAPAAITWIAMPGKTLAVGASTDLSVAIGPMPALSTMRWNLTATYAGGKPGPALAPPAVTLTPAGPGDATGGHAAHGGGATGTDESGTDAENQFFAQAVSDAQRGPSSWAIAGWVVAGLALLGGVVMMLRGRHRAEPDEDEPDDDEGTTTSTTSAPPSADTKEPVAAGSKWSFKG